MDRNGPLSAEISIFRQKLALSAETDLFRLISAFGRKSSPEIPLFRFRQKVFRLISKNKCPLRSETWHGDHIGQEEASFEVTQPLLGVLVQVNVPQVPLLGHGKVLET